MLLMSACSISVLLIWRRLRQCSLIFESRAAAHQRGGSASGYARWAAFKRHGLNSYSSNRNNCMRRNSVSRLSAYHHWGMVSPWRIAREATNIGVASP